jgi:aryl-alcohol dehydrogenase-like predicted oxidoreductase
MNQRQLGKTGFIVGDMGLGCWQFGGAFGPMTQQAALDTMAAAVESGINFFDTADVYGDGRSESLIGRFLGASSSDVYVATKYGREADVYPDNYTQETLRLKTEASLRRLGVDCLDLTQLHCVPIDVLRRGEVFDWLRKLKQEGKIKHFGASVETGEEAMVCMEHDDVASLQIIFNVFRQEPLQGVFAKAKQGNVAVIVRLPLASGLLSGKFTRDTKFAETDHRSYNRDGQQFSVGETLAGLTLQQGVELTEAIRPLVPRGMTMAQMALRWILDHDAVSVVIPGAKSPRQAQENAAASDLAPLPAQLHEQLAEFYANEVRAHIRGGPY